MNAISRVAELFVNRWCAWDNPSAASFNLNRQLFACRGLIATGLAIGWIVADYWRPQLCWAGERWPAGSNKLPGPR